MPAHPDPTFHASAKLAMHAPPDEACLYGADADARISRGPSALAIVDLDPGSKSLGKIVHTVRSCPTRATSFTILAGTLAHRRCLRLQATPSWSGATLIIPGIRSSRIYVIDTKPGSDQGEDS